MPNDKKNLNDVRNGVSKKVDTSNAISDTFYATFNEAKEVKKAKGVLKVIEGPCMQMDAVNNNNRIYSRELIVKRIINNDYVQGLMKKHSLLGEGNHPADRFDVYYPNVCMSIEKLWIPDNDDDKLYGRFAILDTPVGRILNTLLDYGSKVGVSARASGTSTMTPEGFELLNVEDYEFYTFDAVPEPGFSCARPSLLEGRNRQKMQDYSCYSKAELKSAKAFMESSAPKLFSKDLSVIDRFITTQNSMSSEQKKIKKLEEDNKRLRAVNKKAVSHKYEKIARLEKTVSTLREALSAATSSNATLKTRTRMLEGVVNKQRAVIADKNKNIKNKLSGLSGNIKQLTESRHISETNIKLANNLYESNVQRIAVEAGVSVERVKSFYKKENLSAPIKNVVQAIKRMSPFMETSQIKGATLKSNSSNGAGNTENNCEKDADVSKLLSIMFQ